MDLLHGLFVIFFMLRGSSSIKVAIDYGKTGMVNREVVAGNSTLMECSAIPTQKQKFEGDIRYRWYYMKVMLMTPELLCGTEDSWRCYHQDRLQLLDNGNMVLWNAEVPDSGVYGCYANLIGDEPETDNGFFLINVVAPPSEISCVFPHHNTIYPGKPGKFACGEVGRKGNPPAEYRWFKDGQKLPERSSGDPLYSNSSFKYNALTGSLTFIIVSESDFGDYYCEAYNILGVQRCNSTSIKRPIVPKLIRCGILSPGNVLTPGRDQKLFCNISDQARPAPIFKWYRNGSEMVEETTSESGYDPFEGTVILKRPSADDVTDYHCVAASEAGSVRCPSFRPVLGVPPTSATCEFPGGKAMVLGKDYKFLCKEIEVTAFPKPTIYWKKEFLPEYILDPRDPDWGYTLNSTGGVINLKSVNWTDEGQYACVIENEAGSIHCGATIRVVKFSLSGSGNLMPWIIVEAFLVVFASVFTS